MGRKFEFYTGGYFHIYNRGIDKRATFDGGTDYLRFLDGMYFFNQESPIGSLYENSFGELTKDSITSAPLVRIIAYNLLDNHFHFLVEQLQENGVSRFMHKLMSGYTRYYNEKNDRTGPLFSSPFKAMEVTQEGYYDYVEAYIHFNHLVHELSNQVTKSSVGEIKYGKALNGHIICDHVGFLGSNSSIEKYEKKSRKKLAETMRIRREEKEKKRKAELAKILLE